MKAGLTRCDKSLHEVRETKLFLHCVREKHEKAGVFITFLLL